MRAGLLSAPTPSPFSRPSDVLLKLGITGDASGWLHGVGMGASGCFLWDAAWAEEGAVESVSVVVEVDRLLDDDAKAGAEKVVDTADCVDSCESGTSGLGAAAIVAVWAELGVSNIAMDA